MDHSAASAAIASETAAEDSSCSPMDVASQMGFRRAMSPTRQGLSLSLSSQQTVYRTLSAAEHEIPTTYTSPTTVVLAGNAQSSLGSAVVSGGIGGVQSVLLGSKYLKVVQELLDEVINMGKEIKDATTKSAEGTKTKSTKMNRESTPVTGGESSSKEGAEISTAQRQELQMKKAKLVNMLDEVLYNIFMCVCV